MADIRLSLRELEQPLPRVCMVCGRESSYVRSKSLGHQSIPLWAAVLPLARFALFATKPVKIQAPLCADHRYHWDARVLGAFFGVLPAMTVAFIVNYYDPYPWLWLVVVGLVIAWLALLVVLGMTTIRATEITEREITLTRVAPEFVEAMLQADNRARAQAYELPPGFRFVDDPSIVGEPSRTNTVKRECDNHIQDNTRITRPPGDAIRE